MHNDDDDDDDNSACPCDTRPIMNTPAVSSMRESKGGRVKRIGLGPNWILNSDRCAVVIKQQIPRFRRRRTLRRPHAGTLTGIFDLSADPLDPFGNH